MTNSPSPVSKSRSRLLAAAASIAVAGAIGLGAVTSGTVPVLADAVRVDAPRLPALQTSSKRFLPQSSAFA